jgi:putative ABC transport system permease protein
MKWRNVVFKELFERKKRLFTSGLCIVLGVATVVAIHTIMTYSELAVSKELDTLGNNILILPEDATIENYYNADLQAGLLPEEYVTALATSNLEGLDNVSPKLSVPAEIQGKRVTFTGILPKEEFSAKAAWSGAGIFSRPKGCGAVEDVFGLMKKETQVRNRVIDTLEENQVLLGADIARKFQLKEGDKVELLTSSFDITAILPETGTIDDSRIFGHLHTVQQLTGQDSQINAIEVVGCCEKISLGLVDKLKPLVPDAKVVTIAQIIDTQIHTNDVMKSLGRLFLLLILVIGGAQIANDMYGNVSERRREIGTLMAMGATSKTVLRLFLAKALILGLIGGIGGFLIGSFAAVILGPVIAGVVVLPMAELLPFSIILALATTIIASYLPAKGAAKLDPTEALQEV